MAGHSLFKAALLLFMNGTVPERLRGLVASQVCKSFAGSSPVGAGRLGHAVKLTNAIMHVGRW